MGSPSTYHAGEGVLSVGNREGSVRGPWHRRGARSPHQAVRVGPLTFDEGTGELFRDGQPIPLQPKPTLVLAELVAARGSLVERERLYEVAWGDTVVEFDLALNRCIRDIRAAVGDDAKASWFVATVPRRGYRLVVPVEPYRSTRPHSLALWAMIAASLAGFALLPKLVAPGSHTTSSNSAATVLSFQSFGAEVAGIDRAIQAELHRHLELGTRSPRSTGLFVNGVIVPEPDGALLEVTLVRIADGETIWTGRYNPLCDRLVGDPNQLIGRLISREVLKRS